MIKKYQKGFTLMETVVVMGVVGFLLIAVTSILFNSLRAKSRVEVADRVEEEGNTVLRELKENILVASGVGMSCVSTGVGGSQVSFVNARDGEITTLKCIDNVGIASESASGSFQLVSGMVKVSGCNKFAKCEEVLDAPEVKTDVTFSFELTRGTAAEGVENFAKRVFNSRVTVRN